MQMLYQWDLTRAPMDEVTASFWRVRSGSDEMKAMAERLARGAQALSERLDGLIAEAATELAVRAHRGGGPEPVALAAYELDMERDTPPPS
jgi:transcription termination factor NusB